MLTTNSEHLAERIRLLCSYGHGLDRQAGTPGHQRHVAEGYNVPLDPLQAALLRVKLPYLKSWTEKRRELARGYAAGLKDLGVVLPSFRHESAPTFRSFTVRVQNRQVVYERLRQAGVEVVLHYVPAIYRQPVYQDGPNRLPGSNNLPVTDQLVREIICLPVAAELDMEDVQFAIDVMQEALAG
jgi:dTDP-4-amino-4,6-dideoxygalactose transaminase